MNHISIPRLVRSLPLILVCAAIASPAGSVKYGKKKPTPTAKPIVTTERATDIRPVSQSLDLFYAKSGRLSLSVNAMGTNMGFGTVEVEKPENGVVEKAYLMAAGTGYVGHRIEDGEISIDGHRVLWEKSIRNTIGSTNALADVTRFVKSTIDASPPGRVLIDISEDHSDLIDGVILAVVFDSPDEPYENDVALYFGAHATSRDSFVIELPKPVPSNPQDMRYLFGIGISFGLQSSGATDQYSVVDVNTQRLTTAAGGPDDGSPSPGALITVGGLDDSASNPADGYATPENLLSDDEYYDLSPFLEPGDTRIRIATSSPSRDENLFFASLFATPNDRNEVADVPAPDVFAGVGSAAVVGAAGVLDEIVLTAASSESRVGSTGKITAVVRGRGEPVSNVRVQLKIISGPHAGAVSEVRTDASGQATFLYRGQKAGKDLLVAVVDDGEGAVAGSNVVLHAWIEDVGGGFIDISPGMCPNSIEIGVQDLVTVALVGTEGFNVENVDVTSLYLGDAAPIRVQYRDVSRPGEGGDCACSDEGGDGYEDLVLQFETEELVPSPEDIQDGETRRMTLTGSFTSGVSFEATNCVVISKANEKPVQIPEDVLVPVTTETIDPEPRR